VRVRGVVLAVAVVLLWPAAAGASRPLGDLNVTGVTKAVDGKGQALVSYVREDGKIRHVLVWGAVDALPPSQSVPQVHFRLDYSGGLARYGRQVARVFQNRCAPYDGPPLAFLVTACKAPDGS
jgi:hypothetical protein